MLFFFIGENFVLNLLTPDLSLPSLNVSWTQNVGRNYTVSYQRQGDPTPNQISTTGSSILIPSLGKSECYIFVAEVYLEPCQISMMELVCENNGKMWQKSRCLTEI